MSEVIELDVLVVGGGFSGIYQLKHLRDAGFNVKLVESGSDFGGVWYWNRYPGCRVDIPVPFYEFSDPDLWTDWTWSQRFPGAEEVRAYFAYVARKWDLRKDAMFSTSVDSAAWDGKEGRWLVGTTGGLKFKAKFFLPNSGTSAKRYVPDWPGVDAFEGLFLHPSFWPKVEPEVKGKRIAVIGTGSTGIQLCQDLAQQASQLVLFQRTPNLAIPMRQVTYNDKEQSIPKKEYPALYAGRMKTYGGFDFDPVPRSAFDDGEQDRKKLYQELWDHGDFHFWIGGYYDTLFNDDANTEAYNFWRDKVRERLVDPKLKEKFAPMVKPHAFGCKRVSLENGFYEVFNQDHVELVDQHETPILAFTPRGIRTVEKEWEFDVIVCATGYDAVTGGLTQMGITGKDGIALGEEWKTGVKTQLGMAVSGFPNMFFSYGPQAPTAFCNGPSCIEAQSQWIVDAVTYVRDQGFSTIEATDASQAAWAKGVSDIANMSLLPTTKSWYMGDNIPGKPREPLMYLGGVPNYHKAIRESAERGYEGFVVA